MACFPGETQTLDEGKLAVFVLQDLVVSLDSIEESGKSRGKLAAHENMLRTLAGKDQAQLGLSGNESGLGPLEVGSESGANREGTVRVGTSHTSKFAGKRAEGSRFGEVLEVGGEHGLPATERALGKCTNSEQIEGRGGGLGLADDGGSSLNLFDSLEGFDDHVRVGTTNTVG